MKAPTEDRDRPGDRRAPATDRPAEDARQVRPGRPLNVGAVARLQGAAGNRAAARLVASRRAVAPVQRLATETRAGAGSDPKFAAVEADIAGKQKAMKAHPAPAAEASAAAGAAKPPPDDKEAQGKAANAEKMNAAKPGEFDKAAFVRAVNEAIAAQAPKNLDEADKFGTSGKADAVKGQVQGRVSAGKDAAAGAIESTTKAPPDIAAAKDKPVTPLRPDQPPPTPAAPDPAKAVPDAAPPAATDLSAGPRQVDDHMADAGVTDQQLATSNEPEFTGALAEKKEAENHAATAPGQVRAAEARTLTDAKVQAGQAGAAAMAGLRNDRLRAGTSVSGGKDAAKGRNEAQQAQVTATLQKVYDATKKDVEDILSGLDKKVDDAFTIGEKAARDAFTADHKRRMDEYKDKRYSGFTGKLRWVKDQFAGLPDEANQIFVTARKGYVDRMQQVISRVADVIGGELNRAKARIATGRAELQAEVRKLPADLQAIGKQAAGEFAGRFDELAESVDAKGKELVQSLASKYNEALKSVDAEIDAEKEKNQGLVAKAIGAVKGVIDTILKLKDLLLGILAKAAAAVMAIIRDPIGFLGKLVHAVGEGLRSFLANIGEHLKKGLLGWLLGAMASAGLQLPARFDLRGIIMMIGSLLGLTWSAIRGRVVSRGVPEPAMAAVEQSVPVAQKLRSEGIGGIWETIKEKAGDLRAGLFGKITQYLVPTVLIAGITWIISLLNPASAFVKAVKMIIDFVGFVVERGAQIVTFVTGVLDAILAIAGGSAGPVPALIVNALVAGIPVLIGVLAAVLGINGIADKVKSFVQSLSKPVMKAVDRVVGKIVAVGRKLWSKLRSGAGKVADKAKAGVRWVGEKLGLIAVRKSFKAGQESHTLTLLAGDRPLRVIVASTPKDLRTLVAELAPKADEAGRLALHEAGKRYAEIKDVWDENQRIKNSPKSTTDARKAADAKLKEIVPTLTTAAAEIVDRLMTVAQLGGASTAPASVRNLAGPGGASLAAMSGGLAGQITSDIAEKRLTMAAAAVWHPADDRAQIVVASSSPSWPAQVSTGHVKAFPGGVREHAERKIIMWAIANGYRIHAVAAHRPVCPVCRAALFAAKVEHIQP
ncbi:hypothetical protein [Actinokineospora enzanensis]|uniref:hypothetical protein n=1 Tax=Actinokineospora enzanensis TaxID=155975 RepID=UPI00039C21F6|nr:hypothetical protein [Actinokineospora enzanensis]